MRKNINYDIYKMYEEEVMKVEKATKTMEYLNIEIYTIICLNYFNGFSDGCSHYGSHINSNSHHNSLY